MENLTNQEQQYINDMFNRYIGTVERLHVIAKVINEGRFVLDLTEPKIKIYSFQIK